MFENGQQQLDDQWRQQQPQQQQKGIDHVTRGALCRKITTQLFTATISVFVAVFHITTCWLTRTYVMRLVKTQSSDQQYTDGVTLSSLFTGFLIASTACVLLETLRLVCYVSRQRVDYIAELDGLKKPDKDVSSHVFQCLRASKLALALSLMVDHVPLSAILLSVQLQAPGCDDGNATSLPVSVRSINMTLALFGLLADSSWKLGVASGRLIISLANYCVYGSLATWYSTLSSAVLHIVGVSGTSLAVVMASLGITIQLMTSRFDVAPRGLVFESVDRRIQLENWIASSDVIFTLDVNNRTLASGCVVTSLEDFLQKAADSNSANNFNFTLAYNNLRCDVTLSTSSRCLITDIDFRFQRFPIVLDDVKMLIYSDCNTTARQTCDDVTPSTRHNNETTAEVTDNGYHGNSSNSSFVSVDSSVQLSPYWPSCPISFECNQLRLGT